MRQREESYTETESRSREETYMDYERRSRQMSKEEIVDVCPIQVKEARTLYDA